MLEPRELRQRIGVVIDAQVKIGPFFLAVNQKRRRLLAALVAAGRFAGDHRCDQALRKRQRRVFGVGTRGVVQHARAASMLPAMEKPSPSRCPHQSTQSRPV